MTGADEPGRALDDVFGEDAAREFEALPSEEEDDAHLAVLVARSQSTAGREHLSALSALSAQMSAYKPLKPEEQLALLRVYRQGREAQRLLEAGGNNGRRDRKLWLAARAGEAAQTQLVGSMYRLVLMIAREQATTRYGRERALEMLPDLVSEANIVVVEAIEKFDEQRSPAFSMYAGRVIRDKVRAYVSNTIGSMDSMPPSWVRIKRLYSVNHPELEMRLGRTPTMAEMQAELLTVCLRWATNHLSPVERELPDDVQHKLMVDKLKKQGMIGAIQKLPEVLAATQHASSLDAPVGDGNGAQLGDLLAQQEPDSVFDAVEHAELRRDLLAALETLTDRERQIALYKYGFVDGELWSYAGLAPMFGVSAERIRQIDRTVLGKLRGFGGLGSHLPSHDD